MRLSSFLFRSGVALGLLFIGQSLWSRSRLTPTELLRKIDTHSLAAIKSAQLAIEKSTSSLLRETAQQLLDDLTHENEQLRKILLDENAYPSDIQDDAENFKFHYDYNEESSFDLAYVAHQLDECEEMVALLQRAAHMSNPTIKDIALRNLPLFLRYQMELNKFRENFLTVNEYRIREFAYQIWEAEGRPQGQDKRHWRMAVELLTRMSPADLQLVFEQKRSFIDSFATTSNPVMNKNLH